MNIFENDPVGPFTTPLMDINGPVIAIGDIHGERDQIEELLNRLEGDGLLAGRWVIFLGDYVDVGPDTAGTIQLLLKFRTTHPQTIFLCGNHDLNLAKSLKLVESPHHEFYRNRVSTRNAATLASYCATDTDDLLQKMPDDHKEFLANLTWCAHHHDYLFVHCGFDPTESLDDQIMALAERDMKLFKPKWMYGEWLSFADHRHQTDKWIVAGHSIVPEVSFIGNKFLIDTGAGYGGKLSALLLPDLKVIQTDHILDRDPFLLSG